MKEIVFYKKMNIILRYRSVPTDVKDRYRKHSGKKLKGRQRKKKHPI